MATTTTLSEEEIRAGLARGWVASPPVGPSAMAEWSDAWTHVQGVAHGLYDLEELRPSEDERLQELVCDAIEPIAARVDREVVEALVAALLTFAAEHPDAPRRRA